MPRLAKIATAAALLLGAVSLGGAAPGATSVTIQNFSFSPRDLTVPVGATVTWSNADEFQHMLFASEGAFHSPRLSLGERFSFTFPKAGTYAYYCSIHPSMTGRIIVTSGPMDQKAR